MARCIGFESWRALCLGVSGVPARVFCCPFMFVSRACVLVLPFFLVVTWRRYFEEHGEDRFLKDDTNDLSEQEVAKVRPQLRRRCGPGSFVPGRYCTPRCCSNKRFATTRTPRPSHFASLATTNNPVLMFIALILPCSFAAGRDVASKHQMVPRPFAFNQRVCSSFNSGVPAWTCSTKLLETQPPRPLWGVWRDPTCYAPASNCM